MLSTEQVLMPDAIFTSKEWTALQARFAEVEKKLNTAPTTALAQAEFEERGLGSLSKLAPTKADVPLLLAGIGAGSASAVSGILQSRISQLATYKPEYVQLIAGWALYKYFQGKGSYGQYISAFGGGVVIGAVGSLAKTMGLTLDRFVGGATAPASSGSTSAPMSIARVPI
jgi:hypothetical protein